VLVNGRTSQVELTTSQKRLFAKLTLGALNDSGPLKLMPIDDMVQLQPDTEAFSTVIRYEIHLHGPRSST
jgi:hypothetical protein